MTRLSIRYSTGKEECFELLYEGRRKNFDHALLAIEAAIAEKLKLPASKLFTTWDESERCGTVWAGFAKRLARFEISTAEKDVRLQKLLVHVGGGNSQ